MFLDSITVDELARELGVKVEILPADGGKEARAPACAAACTSPAAESQNGGNKP